MDAKLKELYKQTILRHSKQPNHEGTLDSPTRTLTLRNPLCGDEITLYLSIGRERIEHARFEAQCCSICKASASMMVSHIQNSPTQASYAFARSLLAQLNAKEGHWDIDQDSDLNSLRGVIEFPSRIRCATLPWEVLLQAIEEQS